MVKLTCPEPEVMEDNAGRFSGATVSVKLLVLARLGEPLSVTLIFTRLVESAWFTEGRQVKEPFEALSEAFEGP